MAAYRLLYLERIIKGALALGLIAFGVGSFVVPLFGRGYGFASQADFASAGAILGAVAGRLLPLRS
jgi:hypothetical protein